MAKLSQHNQQLHFYIVDVFTCEPLTGNPLAVVADAQSLEETTMQRIAREFNQSETTFLLPTTQPYADWRLRSFTPTGTEVFGAGHNALGAWWWLAETGRLTLDPIHTKFMQEIGARILPVEIRYDAGQLSAIGMLQTAPSFGAVVNDLSELATALHLTQADLIVDQLPAQVVSTGAAHLLVPIRNRATIERARPDAERLASLLRTVNGQGCYLFCLDTLDPSARAHTRFFNPTVGIWEDAATGSAAGPLACYLVARGIVEDNTTIVVEQGYTMERPSRIEVLVRGSEVSVFGSAVVVAEGTLHI
ncbi:MAG: PhzF family phenazine biosynthesis protein [Acidobacteriota bacterium]